MSLNRIDAIRPQPGTAGRVKGMAAALIALSLAACASTGQMAESPAEDMNDPLEPINRVIFSVNDAVDTVILTPIATTYKFVTPDPIENNVTNFLRNLRSPVIIANQLLQGDWHGAEVAATRFFLNSTVGLGGIVDIAAYNKLYFEPEGFGQTLAVWGVGEGPYLVLPLLGPSNPRDAAGLAVDILSDPVWMVSTEAQNWGRSAAEVIDVRARTLDVTEDMKRNSLDYYATVRSAYRQLRAARIRDGAADAATQIPEIPDYSTAEMPEIPDYEPESEPESGPAPGS